MIPLKRIRSKKSFPQDSPLNVHPCQLSQELLETISTSDSLQFVPFSCPFNLLHVSDNLHQLGSTTPMQSASEFACRVFKPILFAVHLWTISPSELGFTGYSVRVLVSKCVHIRHFCCTLLVDGCLSTSLLASAVQHWLVILFNIARARQQRRSGFFQQSLESVRKISKN